MIEVKNLPNKINIGSKIYNLKYLEDISYLKDFSYILKIEKQKLFLELKQ